MIKSKDGMYLKPSCFKYKFCILGIENGFLLTLSLRSLKLETKQTVPFFLGIINAGAPHSDLFLRFKTPIFTNLSTSVLRVS